MVDEITKYNCLEAHDFSRWSARHFRLLNRLASQNITEKSSDLEQTLNGIKETYFAHEDKVVRGVATALYAKLIGTTEETFTIHGGNLGLVIDEGVAVPLQNIDGCFEPHENLRYASVTNTSILDGSQMNGVKITGAQLLEGATARKAKILEHAGSVVNATVLSHASGLENVDLLDGATNLYRVDVLSHATNSCGLYVLNHAQRLNTVEVFKHAANIEEADVCNRASGVDGVSIFTQAENIGAGDIVCYSKDLGSLSVFDGARNSSCINLLHHAKEVAGPISVCQRAQETTIDDALRYAVVNPQKISVSYEGNDIAISSHAQMQRPLVDSSERAGIR